MVKMLHALLFPLSAGVAWVPFFAATAYGQETSTSCILGAQSKLTATLISRLQRTDKETAIVSPASVAAAVALLAQGGDQKFGEAAHFALGYNGNRTAALDLEDLRDASGSMQAGSKNPSFGIASGILIDPKLEPQAEIINLMRASQSDVWIKGVDEPGTIRDINEWVATRTNGLIEEVLTSNVSGGGLIVLNALSFKDDWMVAFDTSRTQRGKFRSSSGTVEDVPMMMGTVPAWFRAEGQFVGVELKYKTPRFSLTLVTTRDDPVGFPVLSNVVDWLAGAGFSQSTIELQLPRFLITRTENLLPALDEAGLERARRDPTAFTRLTHKPIDISAIIQKVYLKVDEQGSEAAAATAILGRSITAKPAGVNRVTFDKPFIFALRDRLTGFVLLSGYVGSLLAECPLPFHNARACGNARKIAKARFLTLGPSRKATGAQTRVDALACPTVPSPRRLLDEVFVLPLRDQRAGLSSAAIRSLIAASNWLADGASIKPVPS